MFKKLLKIVEFIEKKLNNNYKFGSFLYIVIAIIAISIFIPSTLFTVSGGFLFSFPVAFLSAKNTSLSISLPRFNSQKRFFLYI